MIVWMMVSGMVLLQNVLGCDVGEYAGDVKYIADDAKIECEGKDAGKCASNISIPQKNQ